MSVISSHSDLLATQSAGLGRSTRLPVAWAASGTVSASLGNRVSGGGLPLVGAGKQPAATTTTTAASAATPQSRRIPPFLHESGGHAPRAPLQVARVHWRPAQRAGRRCGGRGSEI